MQEDWSGAKSTLFVFFRLLSRSVGLLSFNLRNQPRSFVQWPLRPRGNRVTRHTLDEKAFALEKNQEKVGRSKNLLKTLSIRGVRSGLAYKENRKEEQKLAS